MNHASAELLEKISCEVSGMNLCSILENVIDDFAIQKFLKSPDDPVCEILIQKLLVGGRFTRFERPAHSTIQQKGSHLTSIPAPSSAPVLQIP